MSERRDSGMPINVARSVGSIAIAMSAIALSLVASSCDSGTKKLVAPTTSAAPVTSPSTSPSAVDTGTASKASGNGNLAAASIPVPITNAAVARDKLLEAAKGKEYHGFPVGWGAYQVGLTFAGSLVKADATHVSGYNFVFSTAKDASYLAFAVADTNGTCAGGLLLDDNTTYTQIVSTNPVTVPTGSSCNGQTVADVAGYLG